VAADLLVACTACRYELEKALIEGSIEVDDLPGLWNRKMAEYLGCKPESDARGVLQDVHWSAGLAGYFPTYRWGAGEGWGRWCSPAGGAAARHDARHPSRPPQQLHSALRPAVGSSHPNR
jgi:hypothetical protein